MGCFAFAFPFELAVALPDNTAVAVGGVPGLGTENIAAVGADDLPGEGAGLMVPVAAVFAPFQLHLNLLPFPRLDDGRVAVLHIVLGDFSLVDLGFLGEKMASLPLDTLAYAATRMGLGIRGANWICSTVLDMVSSFVSSIVSYIYCSFRRI